MITANFSNSSEVTTDRLFQWDIGQKLQLLNTESSVVPAVHFCNKKSENAIAVNGTGSGGTYEVSIPNSLLAEEYDIVAYVYITNNNESKTIKIVHIPLTKRPKPVSYVTTDDEDVVDFISTKNEIYSILNGLVVTEYDSTKSYIKPNIVCYQGQTYICNSETEITGVLPTDSTKWGLMSKDGANITTITFSDDTLHFKLENNDIVDVPLGSVEVSTLEGKEAIDNLLTEMANDDNYKLAYPITKDEDGVLKFEETIISRKKLLSNNIFHWSRVNDGGVAKTLFTDTKPILGRKFYIETNYYNGILDFTRASYFQFCQVVNFNDVFQVLSWNIITFSADGNSINVSPTSGAVHLDTLTEDTVITEAGTFYALYEIIE